jgi:GntR family transcriptional regulator
MLRVNAASAVPIWKQIEDEVRRLIATGRLLPGTLVPSVRELARELQVNPATVSRAYQRLVESNFLTVRRGEGTYVTESIPVPSKAARHRSLREGAEAFAVSAISAGATIDDAMRALEEAFEKIQPPTGVKR